MKLPKYFDERISELTNESNPTPVESSVTTKQYIAYAVITATLVITGSGSTAYYQARQTANVLQAIYHDLENLNAVGIASKRPLQFMLQQPQPTFNPWADIAALREKIRQQQALSIVRNRGVSDF